MDMKEKNRPVIGVDLDGVCADFYGRMREIAAEWFETSIESLPEKVSYGLKEWGIVSKKQYESLHRYALYQRELFRTMPMIPGARKYLRKLSDEGFHIRIVTYRLYIHYSHASAVQQTVAWLDGHGIPYWDLCFMKEKSEVGADIYVEDSPENIQKLRNKGIRTICFANSTNMDIEPPRAASWREVYEMITRMA